MKELQAAANRAYESVRDVAVMWGISREKYIADWLSHVAGEKTGLEREYPSW